MSIAEVNKHRTHFRQLCCLGLTDKLVIPDAVKTLHKIIKYETTVFAWLDKHSNIADAYLDFYAPDVVRFYINEYHNLKSPYGLDLAVLAKHHTKNVGNYREMPRQYYKTDMYNLVCKPCDQYFLLDAVIKDGSEPIAAVLLCRQKNRRPFSARDENNLASLLPYFTHALTQKPTMESLEFVDAEPAGIIIATPNGQISHITPRAREILLWTDRNPLRPGTPTAGFERVLAARVKELCRRLESVFQNAPQSPPVLTTNCRHGRLSFRAYRMEPHDAGTPSLIGISVTLQKPAPLAIAEQLQKMPLSPRQKELCLMMGLGKPAGDICTQLHISAATYKDHVQKIYRKLDINRREELLALLRRDTADEEMLISSAQPVITPGARVPAHRRPPEG